MKNTFVKDIKPSLILAGESFVINDIKTLQDKNERPYYDLELGDKTGKIKAKIWSDNIPQVEKQALQSGRVVSIDAKVEEFRGAMQLNILKLIGVDETKMEDFLESSMFPADEMWEELMQKIEEHVSDKHLNQLLHSIFADAEIAKKYKYWRAANSFHHDFRSGLLQHVLEMIAAAEGLERFYPQANFSLVYTGIILHDIGKLEEIDSSGMVPRYTTKGNLIGHVVLGMELVDSFMSADMPEKLRLHLKHIILSHQGELQYASPSVPATLEAMIVYRLDGVSSDARKMDKGMGEPGDEYGISQYNKWLDRWLWVGSRDAGSAD